MTTVEEMGQLVKRATSLRYKGEYQSALDTLDEVIKSLSEIEEKRARLIIGEAIHQLGVTFQNMAISPISMPHHFPAALSYLQIAFSYRKAIGDQIGVAYTSFQIPMCLLAKAHSKVIALPYFEKAEDEIRKITENTASMNDPRMLGDMFQNLAFILQQKGEIHKAIETYLAAGGWRQLAGDRRGEGLTLARLAECELELGHIKEAKDYANSAMAIFREVDDENRINQVRAVLAKIQQK